MDKDLEKKADELLDEREEGEPDGGNGETENERKAISPQEAIDLLRQGCRGTLNLMVPLRAHGQDITELPFDFCALTGMEMMDALDEVPANNILAITNMQALTLFAAAAGKCAPKLDEDDSKSSRLYDAHDVKKRLSGPDCTAAVRLAKLFYNASGQAGSRNISRN